MNPDRNLLLGILALQLDFIDRDALIGAMNAWVRARNKPLGDVLQERGALNGVRRELLESLVREHLALHDSDPAKSLAASTVDSVQDVLQGIDDPEVRASLPEVSRSFGQNESIATQPGHEALAAVGLPPPSSLRYRVVRPHAEGGLGRVSVAVDEELHREVALKEIKERHADLPQSRARFVMEAEITGSLEHPGIVPVYSLGRYADGRPFYAMRFIRGENLQQAIREYHRSAEPNTLALRQLLTRFLEVCNAVAYAHSRGVLHRDLKPNNIMLGQFGETLVVDWGLAKAVQRSDALSDPDESGPGSLTSSGATPTRQGQVIGTPQFMSPEQADGLIEQLGPPSDVYSLGATFYYLLAGCPPFPDTRQVGQDEVLRRVRRGEFPSPRMVNAEVPPALDAICLKAMSLNPGDRYPSARALADDIEHWLADEPVAAWPEPFTARCARWARRHRAIVVSSAALLLTITAASILSAVLLDRKQREAERARQDADLQKQVAEAQTVEAQRQEQIARKSQERAEAEATKKSEIARFLTGMFDASDPIGLGNVSFYIPRRPDEKLKASDILKRGADKIGSELEGQPVVKAAIMATIGDVCRSLGQYEQADQLLHAAYALRQRELSPDDLELADSAQALGWYYHEKGDYERGQQYYEQALTIREKHLPRSDPHVLATLFNLAWLLTQRGDFSEAEKLFREVIAEREKGPASRELALAHFGLAAMYLEKGEPLASAAPSAAGVQVLQLLEDDRRIGMAISLFQQGLLSAWVNKDRRQAIAQLKECLKIAYEVVPETHIYIAFVLFSIGQLCQQENELDQALACYDKCLHITRDTVGLGHPKATVLVAYYSALLHDLGKDEQAEALCKELVQAHRERFGNDHPLVGDALAAHARYRRACNDIAGSKNLLREAVEVYRRDMRWPTRQCLSAVVTLAEMTGGRTSNQRGETQDLLRLALQLCDRLDLKEPTDRALIMLRLARSLQAEKQPQPLQEAEKLLRDACEMGRASKSQLVQKTILSPVLSAQSDYYLQTGQLQEAADKARKLREVWPTDPDSAYASACHFTALIALVGKEKAVREGYYEEAMISLKQALENKLNNADKLLEDDRLAPLKDWPDFQTLMERLKSIR
jgi:serine/threonine protein kinase/tetratricopeptide (TPR) repeat protein